MSNREIKFRAWHKGNNEWVGVTKHFGLDGDGSMYLVSMLKPIVLMQSTGLFDKNGKEIYEGDIVKTSRNYKAIVIYSNGSYWFNSYPFYPGAGKFMGNKRRSKAYSVQGSKNWEVTGNIYENPELTKKD